MNFSAGSRDGILEEVAGRNNSFDVGISIFVFFQVLVLMDSLTLYSFLLFLFLMPFIIIFFFEVRCMKM